MKAQDFAKILKNNDFSQKNLDIFRQELKKFPYFSTLTTAYLITLKINDDLSFKNELTKYSIYITDRRRLLEQLIEFEYLKDTNQLSLLAEPDQEQIDQELYELAKQHHQQIVKEIIEPKIEKLRQLSELSKQVGKKPKPEEKTEEKALTPEAETLAKPEEQPQPEPAVEPPPAQDKKVTQPTAPPTTEEKPKPKPEQKAEKETKTDTTLDDIFRKIEQLKKQKLQAAQEFKKRVQTVNQLIEDQKVREEYTPPKPAAEPEAQPPKPETPKTAAEPQPKEQKTATEKQKSDLTTKPETPAASKAAAKPTAPEKQTAVETAKPEPVETQPQPTQPQEPSATQQQKTAEDTIIEFEIPQPTAKPQQETTSKTAEKKSAADRILEEIAKRRELRKKKQQEQNQIIDKFLQQQPSIDRTKEPATKGDLSEPHTKEVEIITEKMARIYEMQGLYDKAIEIYEKLSLQKPEKKDYFAQKISQLKQKLNN